MTKYHQIKEWKSLPGGILSYGDTGFEIQLNSDARQPPYTMVDPDGRKLPYWTLESAKQDVVRQQREREEFST